MRDIALVFSFILVFAVGIKVLDGTLDTIAKDAATTSAHGLPGFLSSCDTAEFAGRSRNRPVVLVFASASHPSTQKLKDSVLQSSHIAALKERFVWAFIDTDLPRNQSAVQGHDVSWTPQVRIYSSEGEACGALNPFMPVHVFANTLLALGLEKKASGESAASLTSESD